MRDDYFASDEFKQNVGNLIREMGLSGDFVIKTIERGRNNRVFCIEVCDWGKALLKVYFRHPNDPRDRLRNEFSFSKFAWENGLRCLHKPFVSDYEKGLALYQFIEGRKVNKNEVNKGFIEQALDFFIGLNKFKHIPKARELANASEACFSIQEHIGTIQRRIDKLKAIDPSSEVNMEVISFVNNELLDAWVKVMANVNRVIDKYKLNANEEISSDAKCISPSDFGYHNAILGNDGKLYFVDFEYAGWDDPAKMVCDFFCQPEIPVPLDFYDFFVGRVFSEIADSEEHIKRTNVLLPIYRIKWCCIMLNEFLKHDSERRSFVQQDINYGEQKSKQLAKVKEYLKNLDKFILNKQNI